MIGSQSAFIEFIPVSESSVGIESIGLASRIKIHEGSILRTTISSMYRCRMFDKLVNQTCGMYVMCVAFIASTVSLIWFAVLAIKELTFSTAYLPSMKD